MKTRGDKLVCTDSMTNARPGGIGPPSTIVQHLKGLRALELCCSLRMATGFHVPIMCHLETVTSGTYWRDAW